MEDKASGFSLVSEEQTRYGAVLGVASKIGLLAIIITFTLYVVGLPKPHIPVGDVSNFWGLKVDKYLEQTGIQHGWSWFTKMGESDFLNFGPIAFLAAVTVVCYLTVIPLFLQKKDIVYAALAILEVLVLVLAASGVLPSGGH